MVHWLHSLLPQFPHFGYVLVFVVLFLNNIGIPLPGDTTLLGGLWAFWLGRRLGYSGIKKIPWLHLTLARVNWAERFFKRHGPKTVFVARFIFPLPPIAANLLAGMAKMKWGLFLFYNITGSAAYVVTYILIGYFFGKRWKLFQAWLGPTAPYYIAAGILLIVLGCFSAISYISFSKIY